MRELPTELMEKLPNGLPKVSQFAEYRRITGADNGDESFQAWLRAAVTVMMEAKGNA